MGALRSLQCFGALETDSVVSENPAIDGLT